MKSRPERYRSLDGLRGVAALIVLFSHVANTNATVARAIYGDREAMADGSPLWLLTYTPAHLLWMGQAAVYVFFVLSGFVLMLPILRARDRFDWLSYYPRRLVRLYVPVWVAVAFGTLLAALIPRVAGAADGPWLQARPSASLGGLFHDLTLLVGPSRVISPLWSLQWEIWFSLLLPVFAWFAVSKSCLWPLKAVLLLLASTAGEGFNMAYLAYLPIFALGCLLAVHLDELNDLARRVQTPVWVTICVAAVLLLTSRWLIAAVTGSSALLAASWTAVTCGAVLAVLAAAFWSPLSTALEARPIQWLGKVSFSLYLIHEPIVLAFAFGLRPWSSVAAIPVSLFAAAVFYRLVESPSHRLAQAVGRTVGRKDSVRV